ncbi:ankyrin repeat-containing protein [Carex littledalei]|uniref:Ankyrin repeat-containing protein n=1 Tax=Carex littledalei TaxID=544730 RepID=A0A833VEM3_9POAL|nr:ankyrin repeat-containing protein [Carex littledalei]
MDPALHKAVTQGNLQQLKRILTADPKILLSRTPEQNTALHIAARLGHRHFAERILRECETLMLEKNIDGETPLHIASKFGKKKVVDLLINYSVERPIDIESEGPFTATNKLGNTALHEAVIHGKSEVALRLLEAKPDVGRMLNGSKQSPLHIAAREGMAMVVKEILKQSWVEKAEETQLPVSGTELPLHQAVVGGPIKTSDFVKHMDSDDNNTLHYAAQSDNAKIVKMLIIKDRSLAYANNNWGQPPLHVAVQYGYKSAIKAILKHCPDTAEQLGKDGGNALHVAVNNGKFGSLKCLLKLIQPEEIINHQDCNGNTPLHLAAMQSMIQSSLLLLRDRRVNPCLLNQKGQTARSVIEMLDANIYEMYIWRELKKQEKKRSQKQQLPPVPSSRFFGRKKDYFELSVQTYTLVAALIATVTFAAFFTMPGGYDQTKGFAILGNKPAFEPFVISNTIAMCSALVVMFCFIWASRDPLNLLYKLKWGHRLTVVACLSMIVSVMNAVYLVIEPKSRWLSIVVILIGCSTPIGVGLILGHEVLLVPFSL